MDQSHLGAIICSGFKAREKKNACEHVMVTRLFYFLLLLRNSYNIISTNLRAWRPDEKKGKNACERVTMMWMVFAFTSKYLFYYNITQPCSDWLDLRAMSEPFFWRTRETSKTIAEHALHAAIQFRIHTILVPRVRRFMVTWSWNTN